LMGSIWQAGDVADLDHSPFFIDREWPISTTRRSSSIV